MFFFGGGLNLIGFQSLGKVPCRTRSHPGYSSAVICYNIILCVGGGGGVEGGRDRVGGGAERKRGHTLSKNPSMTYSAGSSTSGKNGISDSLPWPCHDCRRNKKGEEKNRRRDPSWHGVQSIITNHIDISFCGGNGSVSRPPATLDRDGVRRSHRYRQIESWNRRRQKKGTGRTGGGVVGPGRHDQMQMQGDARKYNHS